MDVFRESLPERKRWEKLLPWFGALVLAVGVIALIIKLVPGSNGATPNAKTEHPQVVASAPKTVKLSPTARQVAGTFILTAVARKNLDKAWKLVGPQIRQDLTYKEWLTGNIPVIPYLNPIKRSPIKVDYSYPNEALIEVQMVPTKGSDIEYFWVELKRVHKHWLVWSWAPHDSPPIPVNPGGG